MRAQFERDIRYPWGVVPTGDAERIRYVPTNHVTGARLDPEPTYQEALAAIDRRLIADAAGRLGASLI